VADRSVASTPTSNREIRADLFITRLTVLGAAAFGFLVTFLLLDHEIHAPKNVMLPLLSIGPAYLFLASLNTWWAARTAAKISPPTWAADAPPDRHRNVQRAYTTCCGLAFGVIAALWYIHSVSR
jgi:predicted outer membrane lipoprotein